jgi:hypothetical protein
VRGTRWLVAAIVVLVAVGLVSAYEWRHHSNSTNGGSAQGWTGEYFWETGPAHAPTDAVLLTLLQSSSGVGGTWNEASSSDVTRIDDWATSGSRSTPVESTNVTAGSLILTGTPAGNFQANTTGAGLTLTYTPSGGGIQTLNFERVSNAQPYNQAVRMIQQEGNSGSSGP